MLAEVLADVEELLLEVVLVKVINLRELVVNVVL